MLALLSKTFYYSVNKYVIESYVTKKTNKNTLERLSRPKSEYADRERGLNRLLSQLSEKNTKDSKHELLLN